MTAATWAPSRSIGARATGYALVVGLMIATAIIAALGPPPLGETLDYSTLVVDREGRLLRPYPTPEGRWRLPAIRENVDPRYVSALLAYEDKRFESHFGVDPLALARAALQLIRSGHIVSGGSTITMQVARLLEPRRTRSVRAKLREIVRAIEIERMLSKDEILRLYLSLAPGGGNLEGVRAASLAYFGKEPRRLSLAETALLVSLPQSPEARRPDHSNQAAKTARDRVLDRLAAAGLVPPDEVVEARREPVPERRRPMPTLGPHAADQAVATDPGRKLHHLTLDATLQRSLEALAANRARALGPEISVAIVAVDNATGEIRAHVGSADYFDNRRAGQIDMTMALRSPGSALKPFIYGLAFEDGLIHPETMIDDRPARYGTYVPENFDLSFQGTVTVRHALQRSLNVPAVGVLDAVGPKRLATCLRATGAELVLPKGETPGLAIGLGGIGIRLTDLTMLYTALARLGMAIPVFERRELGPGLPRRLLDPVAAWYVGNILLGTPPPENALGGRIAFKTGTSYGDRDAWAIGFDGRSTLGVWVGRPDGAPVPGLVGRNAAAPILFEAFARQARPPAPLPPAPKGALIAATARLPPPLQQFRWPDPGAQPVDPLRILFPPDGVTLERPAGLSPGPLALRVTGGVTPLTVLVNGVALADTAPGTRSLSWEPDGPGFVRLTVMDARGAADSVVVRVQ
jgi:penicillin-binding protein 1C